MALAMKMQNTAQVVACFFGDGAVAEGAFHEGINMAALWKLPVIFVCENNTLRRFHPHQQSYASDTRISNRAAHYGFRGQTVDGNDVLAVYEAAKQAAEECRSGKGPVLLELLTYRRTGHSRRDPCGYQPKTERDDWFSRDPLDRFATVLKERGDEPDGSRPGSSARVAQQINESVELAKQAPQPTPGELLDDVLAPVT